MTYLNRHISRGKWVFAALGILISLFFLWISFRSLDPEQVLANIGRANFSLLLIAALVYFIGLTLISARWHFVLRSVKSLSTFRLLPLVAICYMGNNVYPFRTGEIIRIFLLQRNHKVPVTKTATTIFAERMLDGMVMIAFVFLGLLLVDIQSPEVRRVAGIATPMFLAGLLVFFALATRPQVMRWLAKTFVRPLPSALREKALHFAEEIIESLEGMRTPADLFGAILFSFLSWMVEAFVYWLVAFAFGLQVGYPVMLMTVGVVNLAGLIPASPGQIGVYEFFVSTVLIAVGVSDLDAKAYALVVHMVIWLPVTLVGGWLLLRQGLNFGAITHVDRLETQLESEMIP